MNDKVKNGLTLTCSFGGTLLGIMVIGALFRFPLLSSIPNGFFCDEASVGYAAYSIMQTGRDRHGDFLPLFAKSFGDYREATYSYAAIPFIATLGLNELATRLPAAVFGTLTILALGLLVKELFDEKMALVTAALLAINPWHVQLSRMAWSTIFMPLFLCLALLFFIQAVKGKTRKIYISALFFSLSLWIYQSARVFVPLFAAGVCIIYFKDLWRMKRHALFASLIFLLVLMFFIRKWLSPIGMARANQVMEGSVLKVLSNYLSYFSPHYLFIKGDGNLRHSILDTGGLHLFEFVTVVVGILGVLSVLKRKESKLLVLWLILYPIPAALTQATHALRSFIGVPVLVILSAYGFITLASLIKSRKRKMIFNGSLLLIMLFSAGLFSKRYFKDYPKYSAWYWDFGMRDAIEYAEKEPSESVYISTSFGYSTYIFVLFYTEIPPLVFQQDIDLDYLGRGKIGKYHVSSLSEPLEVQGRTILIGKEKDRQKLFKIGLAGKLIHLINDPEGREAARIFEVKRRLNSKNRVLSTGT